MGLGTRAPFLIPFKANQPTCICREMPLTSEDNVVIAPPRQMMLRPDSPWRTARVQRLSGSMSPLSRYTVILAAKCCTQAFLSARRTLLVRFISIIMIVSRDESALRRAMNDIESEVPLSWWTRLTQALIRDPAITLLDTHDAEHDADDMRRASSRFGESIG